MNWGNKIVIATASGKGGIGKSCFVANMAVAIANSGKKVSIIDADHTTANIHTMLGAPYPEKSIKDFLSNKIDTIENTFINTPYPNLQLLSSAGDLLSLINLKYSEKQRLLNSLCKLNTDYIIFDIAAGADQRAIDFFTFAPIGVIMVQPIPTSFENAYSFLKNLLMRHLLRIFFHNREMNQYIKNVVNPKEGENIVEFSALIDILYKKAPGEIISFKRQVYSNDRKLLIVVNNVRSKSQIDMVDKFRSIIKKYLLFDINILGNLPFDPFMDTAITSRIPFIAKYPDSDYTIEMLNIISNIKSIF